MNIITPTKRNGIVASLVILTAIGGGGTYAVSSMMDDEPEEVKHVATSQKAKVMKEDSAETPVVEPENTAVVEVAEQSAPSQTPESVAVIETPQSNNPYPLDSPHGYVYDKREKAGKTVGVWGPARLWVQYARAAGASVSKSPQVGDAYSVGDYIYYVEAVNENSITVSTYLNGVKSRDMSKEEASIGWFIH